MIRGVLYFRRRAFAPTGCQDSDQDQYTAEQTRKTEVLVKAHRTQRCRNERIERTKQCCVVRRCSALCDRLECEAKAAAHKRQCQYHQPLCAAAGQVRHLKKERRRQRQQPQKPHLHNTGQQRICPGVREPVGHENGSRIQKRLQNAISDARCERKAVAQREQRHAQQTSQRADQRAALRPTAAEHRLNDRHDDNSRIGHEGHRRGFHRFERRELRRHDAKIDAAHGQTAQQCAAVDVQQPPPKQHRQKRKRQQKPHCQQREFAHVLQTDLCKHIRRAARNDDRRQ